VDARPARTHLVIVPLTLILDLIEFENACTLITGAAGVARQVSTPPCWKPRLAGPQRRTG
jgi:hypothetical protein